MLLPFRFQKIDQDYRQVKPIEMNRLWRKPVKLKVGKWSKQADVFKQAGVNLKRDLVVVLHRFRIYFGLCLYQEGCVCGSTSIPVGNTTSVF